MNRESWLARILTIGGVLEGGVGLALLIVPSAVAYLLLRSTLDSAGLVVARLAGGALLALGIACWSARKTPTAPAGLGVSRGFLAYNWVAWVTLFLVRPPLANGGVPALAASALHGVLTIALLIVLFAPRRSPERR